MSELNEHFEKSDKYNQNFSYKENKSYLKISFERITFIFFIFFILAIIFSSKVILLSAKDIPEIKKNPPSRSAKLRYAIKINQNCEFKEFREKFKNLINLEDII